MAERASRIGIVAIGRNEGERLKRCLRSLADAPGPVVYVDSASTDGSPEAAQELGVTVHALDMARPFTAARARAEGLDLLLSMAAGPEYIMFVDGDCEVETGWLDRAVSFLDDHPGHAVVCGRRRERFPEQSIYNKMMDIEWDTPIGDAAACGGDALFRLSAYREAGGYDPRMVAHEEPELCSRIRRIGWKIARIDAPMTIHDANVVALRPYLKRGVRGGFGYSQALSRMDLRFAANEIGLVRRALQWPALIVLSLFLAFFQPWLGLIGPAALALSVLRDAWRHPSGIGAFQFAALRLLSKLSEFAGVLRWIAGQLRRRETGAILYK